MTEQHDPVVSRYRRISMLLLVLVAGTGSYSAIERGQHAMNPNAFASSSGASKPLIDTLAPKKTATATFAMG